MPNLFAILADASVCRAVPLFHSCPITKNFPVLVLLPLVRAVLLVQINPRPTSTPFSVPLSTHLRYSR